MVGLACELWCKSREERGMPVSRFTPQNMQPPAETNMVMVEVIGEMVDRREEPSFSVSTEVLHVPCMKCDCSECTT